MERRFSGILSSYKSILSAKNRKLLMNKIHQQLLNPESQNFLDPV